MSEKQKRDIDDLSIIVEFLGNDVKKLSEKSGDHGERLRKVEAELIRREASVEKAQEAYSKVGKLEKKPAEKWDRLVWTAVTTIISLVIGYLAGHFT